MLEELLGGYCGWGRGRVGGRRGKWGLDGVRFYRFRRDGDFVLGVVESCVGWILSVCVGGRRVIWFVFGEDFFLVMVEEKGRVMRSCR